MQPQKASDFLNRRMNQHGLGGIVESGQLCRQAEIIAPELFTAVSVRNQVLHVRLTKKQLLAYKMQEGHLLKMLNAYATEKHLPIIKSIRLTFATE